MSADAKIWYEPWDTNRRLYDLGLTEEPIMRACQAGLLASLACTENHPVIFSATSAWAEVTCKLREEYIPLGWVRLNETGQELVVNPDHTLAIVVASGDHQTGRKDGAPPRTTCPKGPQTIAAVAENKQLFLFAEMQPRMSSPSDAIIRRVTWLLLMCRDYQAQELRCELSQPVGVGTDGHVNRWAERIILRCTPFDKIPLNKPRASQTPEIDIAIKKRA
jgi:hypothetical protein